MVLGAGSIWGPGDVDRPARSPKTRRGREAGELTSTLPPCHVVRAREVIRKEGREKSLGWVEMRTGCQDINASACPRNSDDRISCATLQNRNAEYDATCPYTQNQTNMASCPGRPLSMQCNGFAKTVLTARESYDDCQ